MPQNDSQVGYVFHVMSKSRNISNVKTTNQNVYKHLQQAYLCVLVCIYYGPECVKVTHVK